MTSEQLITAYYTAFNSQDYSALLALLTDDVVHDVNQGGREVGRDAFAAFTRRMDTCYRERIVELVVLTEPTGTRAAAEFCVEGVYLQTDPGFPPACGQKYRLPVCATFALRDGKVARVSTFYNVREWLLQIQR